MLRQTASTCCFFGGEEEKEDRDVASRVAAADGECTQTNGSCLFRNLVGTPMSTALVLCDWKAA